MKKHRSQDYHILSLNNNILYYRALLQRVTNNDDCRMMFHRRMYTNIVYHMLTGSKTAF